MNDLEHAVATLENEKDILERDLGKLVSDFERRTGMIVSGVRLYHLRYDDKFIVGQVSATTTVEING